MTPQEQARKAEDLAGSFINGDRQLVANAFGFMDKRDAVMVALYVEEILPISYTGAFRALLRLAI